MNSSCKDPTGAACRDKACIHTITSKTPDRAMKVAEWTINTGEWPRMAQIGQLAAEHQDLKVAIATAEKYIRKICNLFLNRTEHGTNQTALSLMMKWVKSGFFDAIVAGHMGGEQGSTSHTYYECLQVVSEVREWESSGVTTPFTTPFREPAEPNRLVVQQV